MRAQHSVSGVAKTDAQHVRHMGGLVESAEAYARNMLETYLSKMKMVVNRVRDDSGRADVDTDHLADVDIHDHADHLGCAGGG